MGGYGSGRGGSGRRTTDPLLFLDIRYMRRAGLLRPASAAPYSFSLAWAQRGEPSGNISVLARHGDGRYPPELVLNYSTKAPHETTWTPVLEVITIETTECHYGGERPWLLCPRCFSRRAVLFSVDGRFRCRECHDVAYTSTRETEEDRRCRRALAIQKRLGGHKHGTIFDPEPKPPHMHWSTYDRLCDELDDLARASYATFFMRFGKLEKGLAGLEDMSLGEIARLL